MPCYDDRAHSTDVYEKKVNKLTEMLCRILTVLESGEQDSINTLPIDDEIGVWWEEHKLKDKQREGK